jgi:hypothetical protein
VRFTAFLHVVGASWLLFWALLNLVLGGPSSVLGMFILGVPVLLFGLAMFGAADNIASLTYPTPPEPSVSRSSPIAPNDHVHPENCE